MPQWSQCCNLLGGRNCIPRELKNLSVECQGLSCENCLKWILAICISVRAGGHGGFWCLSVLHMNKHTRGTQAAESSRAGLTRQSTEGKGKQGEVEWLNLNHTTMGQVRDRRKTGTSRFPIWGRQDHPDGCAEGGVKKGGCFAQVTTLSPETGRTSLASSRIPLPSSLPWGVFWTALLAHPPASSLHLHPPAFPFLQLPHKAPSPAPGRAEPLWSLEQLCQQGITDHGRSSPLPPGEWLGFQNQVAQCHMGLCNPTGALGNAALGYSNTIWTENLHLGLFSVGSSLPPHHRPAFPVPQSTHKKSSGPSAPGAREHNLPPAPSQEEQKAFFPQSAAAEHIKERDQYLSTIAVSFKCPQPLWLCICSPFPVCFTHQEFTSFPTKRAPKLDFSEPALIHNPKQW